VRWSSGGGRNPAVSLTTSSIEAGFGFEVPIPTWEKAGIEITSIATKREIVFINFRFWITDYQLHADP
jgi:hypothetical protein